MTSARSDVTAVPLVHIAAYYLQLPLKRPYDNALGRLHSFDAMVIAVDDGSGRTGWGEACPVTGYSPESPAQAWDYLARTLPFLVGKTPDEIATAIDGDHEGFPFVVSAIHEALDDLAMAPSLYGGDSLAPVELLGTVNTLVLEEAPASALELVEQGYRTLKVKVGYDPVADAARVNAIANVAGGRAVLRMDANQGYTLDEALDFARRVPADIVQVFEQPVPAERWDWIEDIAGKKLLPIMLDESIYGTSDIRRASSLDGVTAVKLKMSKSGGPTALADHIALCRQLDLDVVIGNGVASDIGCYHEGLAYGRLGLNTAAEMNGFLKTVDTFLTPQLVVDGPLLRLPDPSNVVVDRERIVALASKSLRFDQNHFFPKS